MGYYSQETGCIYKKNKSEGLGYHSLRTTEIYMKSFVNSALDNANNLTICLLCK